MSSKKPTKVVNLKKMTLEDIKSIDLSDPKLLKQFKIKPLSKIDKNDKKLIKKLFNECIIMTMIYDERKKALFELIKEGADLEYELAIANEKVYNSEKEDDD